MDAVSPESVVRSFSEAASVLGFAFTPHFSISLPGGVKLQALGLVHEFGAPNGALVFLIDTAPSPSERNAIQGAGYYHSMLSAEAYGRYDEREFVDMLNDWGFFGAHSNMPKWYTGRPWS